jgi:hypothetical protein
MSLVKQITPETDKAREFCARYGDTFVIEWIEPDLIEIRSAKTQETLVCDVKDGMHINGQKVDWERKGEP